MIYTVFVFIALAAFDNIIIGLFPPLFSSIAKDMNVQISSLGIISEVNILVTSFSSILWGYLTGKFNRKLLVIIGTILAYIKMAKNNARDINEVKNILHKRAKLS